MNLYPVKTTIDGAIVRNCRLVSEGGHTTVWQWDRDAGTGTVLSEIEGDPQRVGASERWRVGDLVMEPQRGCGCGHPMYRWVPPAHADA